MCELACWACAGGRSQHKRLVVFGKPEMEDSLPTADGAPASVVVPLLARPNMPVSMSAAEWRDRFRSLPKDTKLHLVSTFGEAAPDRTEREQEYRTLFESDAAMRVDYGGKLDPRHAASLWSLQRCLRGLDALHLLRNVVSVEINVDLPTDHFATFGGYRSDTEFRLWQCNFVDWLHALQRLTVVVGALDCRTTPDTHRRRNVLEQFWEQVWCPLAESVQQRAHPIEHLEIRYAADALVGRYDDFILAFLLRATALWYVVDITRDVKHDDTQWFFQPIEYSNLHFSPDGPRPPKARSVILRDFGSFEDAVDEERKCFERACQLMHVAEIVFAGAHTFQPRLLLTGAETLPPAGEEALPRIVSLRG